MGRSSAPAPSPWDTTAPSSFTADSKFTARGKDGRSASQIAMDAVAKQREQGLCTGTIKGLSRKGNTPPPKDWCSDILKPKKGRKA